MRALVFVAVMLCVFATGVSVCAADYSVSFHVRYKGITAERAAQVAKEAVEKFGGAVNDIVISQEYEPKAEEASYGWVRTEDGKTLCITENGRIYECEKGGAA